MRGLVTTEGNLAVVDFGRTSEPELTKRQLEPLLGKSGRWIEQRMAEGMPSTMRVGKRRFLLSECRSWLADHGRSVESG
jgi:predicted DNA-binding transcriptional regulator AlpA